MACLRFALGGDIKHVMYTDSSSARQLASHQGVGRVRHFCGKVLWIQDKTNAGEITLRQVGTTWNLADIGTKALAQHRLSVLMNETGLVYVNTFEEVGADKWKRLATIDNCSALREQNAALAVEAFSNASQIQSVIIAVLEANANSTGVTMSPVNEVRNIFQRMFRVARNRGDEERATSYRRYVDDLHGMMGGGA